MRSLCRQGRRAATFVLMAMLGSLAAGCGDPSRAGSPGVSPGYVYYLDGAGGGSPLINWSGGVRSGLKAAGHDIFGEMFPWQTGLGALADQEASVEYKREKAKELAARIQTHRNACAGDPVHLIGLSAGTVVAVFALEMLPEDCPADTVVLLGSSLSSEYDLTKALRRVRNKLYVFTSQGDEVLALVVPLTGTADHGALGIGPAGIKGLVVPASASEETRRLYTEKVVQIAWKPEFGASGHNGSHLGNVSEQFVRDHIAPLIVGGVGSASAKPETPPK